MNELIVMPNLEKEIELTPYNNSWHNKPRKTDWTCQICKTKSSFKGICYKCLKSKDINIQEKIIQHESKISIKSKYVPSDIKVYKIEEFMKHDLYYLYTHRKGIRHREFFLSMQTRELLKLLNKGIILAKPKAEVENEKKMFKM